MNADIKVSVITVCLNSEKTLKKTMQSVFEQTYSNIEYVVIDGQSSDKTWDIIQKDKEKITYCCSEPDKGIYDAMNKGIAHCSGEIIAFLNSDDWYIPETIEKVVECYINSKADIVYGDYIFWCSEEEQHYSKCNKDTNQLNYHMIFGHQATFIRRELFNKLGCYNLNYRIAADYEWFLRAYHSGATFAYLPEKLCFFRNGGLCTRERVACVEEVKEIAEKYDTDKKWDVSIKGCYKKEIQEAKWDCYIENVINGKNVSAFQGILQKVGMRRSNIYLFGSGKYGLQSARWCKKLGIEVIGMIDNAPSKWGTSAEGLLINNLENCKVEDAQVLICSFHYENEISEQLKKYGLRKGKDYIGISEIRSCVFD